MTDHDDDNDDDAVVDSIKLVIDVDKETVNNCKNIPQTLYIRQIIYGFSMYDLDQNTSSIFPCPPSPFSMYDSYQIRTGIFPCPPSPFSTYTFVPE